MILSFLGCLAGCALSWAGLGFPREPLAAATLLVPGLWGLGLLFRRRGLLNWAWFLGVGLASATAAQGDLTWGLGAMGAFLWSWDLGWVEVTLTATDPGRLPRWIQHYVARRSGAIAAVGLGLGWGFSQLRLGLPFWVLVALALVFWAAVFFLIRAIRLFYGEGGETKGKRSSSRPMR